MGGGWEKGKKGRDGLMFGKSEGGRGTRDGEESVKKCGEGGVNVRGEIGRGVKGG